MFDRKSAQSHSRRWLPESSPKLASKGNCVVSRRVPDRQSESLDKVSQEIGRDLIFGGGVHKGPQKDLKIRTKLIRVSCKPREPKPSPRHGCMSGIKLAFGSA